MGPKVIPNPPAGKITFVIHHGIAPLQVITLDVVTNITQLSNALVELQPNGYAFGDNLVFQMCDNWQAESKLRKYTTCSPHMGWGMDQGGQVLHLNYVNPQVDFVMHNPYAGADAATSISRTGATVIVKFKTNDAAQAAVDEMMQKYEMLNEEVLAKMEEEDDRVLAELQAKKAARAKMAEKMQKSSSSAAADKDEEELDESIVVPKAKAKGGKMGKNT